MSSNTIQKSLNQELKALNEEQQNLILNYLAILTTNSSSNDIEEEWVRASEILKKAEKDQRLLKFLELIDYFCAGNPEVSETDDDRRAYFSEYIGVLGTNRQINEAK